jgi:putative PIN family toxin of toxin-antitoxin system
VLDVVADTNVYVSAFNFGGPPLEIVILAIRREIALFISPSILREIEGVLLSKFKRPAEQAREVLGTIREFTRSVDPKEKIDALKEDESDNRILECAVEAKAHVIITGDKHFQVLRAFRGIVIMSPRGFLDAYSAGVFSAG